MTPQISECYISVDVETAGPIPGKYSLLSIGACLVEDDTNAFECLIKPISDEFDAKALEVTGFELSELKASGLEPLAAMKSFQEWILAAAHDKAPVFVGFNAGFDWSFINYYFHTYVGSNPFGFAPLDIKAFYMGATGVSWRETKSSKMSPALGVTSKGDHTALNDARVQAELFRRTMLQVAR